MITCLLFILFYKCVSPSVEIINVLVILDFVLIGGILPLLERKKLALIQRRVGPKYVGFNGRLQFIADSIKIFLKDYFFLFRSNKYTFYIMPVIYFIVTVLFLFNFQWGSNIFLYDIELNIIFLVMYSSCSTIIVFFTGYFSKSKYTIVSSTRAVGIFFINEILFTIILCQFVYLSNSFSFSEYAIINKNNCGFFIWLPILPILIFLFLLEVGKSPFDFLESESELVMGYTTEYTGFLFGIYILAEYMHIFVYTYVFVVFLF